MSSSLLCNLLQPAGQEQALDALFDWHRGHEAISLAAAAAASNNSEASRRELSDDQLICQDLVLGLMRMNIMERLMYLLKAYQPALASDIVLNNVFAILFRFARHSPDVCTQLASHRLVDCLIDICLSKSDAADTMDVDTSTPTPTTTTTTTVVNNAAKCIKLLRLLSSGDSNLAVQLFDKYKLVKKCASYLEHPGDHDDSSSSSSFTPIHVEVLRLLKVMVLYHPARVFTLIPQALLSTLAQRVAALLLDEQRSNKTTQTVSLFQQQKCTFVLCDLKFCEKGVR